MIHYRVDIDDLHSHHFRVTLTVPRPAAQQELALPVWIEYMSHALKGVPVQELTPPEGVTQVDGDWAFEEFSRGAGVRTLGLEDVLPPTPSSDERNSILDLFRR